LIVVMAIFFIAQILDGNRVAVGVVGLVGCVVAAVSLLRFYLKGGKPLDRGGRPFWQQERWGSGPVPDRAPVAGWFRARKQRRKGKGTDAPGKDPR
jgi:hypothetical protein